MKTTPSRPARRVHDHVYASMQVNILVHKTNVNAETLKINIRKLQKPQKTCDRQNKSASK